MSCGLDEYHRVPSIELRRGERWLSLLPGAEATEGDWTYRLLYTLEVGPAKCRSADGYVDVDGLGDGVLTAYRTLR